MTGERIDEILASTGKTRVVVVGDVMLDRYLEGQVDRISPEAPVPVVSLDREWDALGGAGNVALNVQALGAACDLIGVIGPDASGERIRETLDARGLGSRLVVDEVTLLGSRCGAFAPALDLLRSGLVDPRPLIDARYPLSRTIDAFAHAARPGALKVLIEFG